MGTNADAMTTGFGDGLTETMPDWTVAPAVGSMMIAKLDLALARPRTPSVLRRVSWSVLLVLVFDVLALWMIGALVASVL